MTRYKYDAWKKGGKSENERRKERVRIKKRGMKNRGETICEFVGESVGKNRLTTGRGSLRVTGNRRRSWGMYIRWISD